LVGGTLHKPEFIAPRPSYLAIDLYRLRKLERSLFTLP
jgi:hypothetical protein